MDEFQGLDYDSMSATQYWESHADPEGGPTDIYPGGGEDGQYFQQLFSFAQQEENVRTGRHSSTESDSESVSWQCDQLSK